MLSRRPAAALVVAVGSLVFASAANAAPATLAVDDDGIDCPAAPYSSVQAAIDAAHDGDTIAVCPGRYVEGPGTVGSNALTITKSLTIKGAGADAVSISPKASSPTGGRIAENPSDLRDGLGDIVAIVGTPTVPLHVEISGVTVNGYDPAGRPVAAEAGILFLDAKGAVLRSRVTNIVTSEGDNAYTRTGGWRGDIPGYGIVQTTNALAAPVDGARPLHIEQTRVDKYNKVGVLIDGAQNDAPPLMASGVLNQGFLVGDQIIGRTECVNYAGTGNCATVDLLKTGPLFGQDGVRVTAGSKVAIRSSLVSQNLVNGEGAPTRNSAENNENLLLGAGVRLIGALASSIETSNITDNAYGVINTKLDGTSDAASSARVAAEGNWWGMNIKSPASPGPAISPTTNPVAPENPVNGVETPDGTGTTSTTVDFFPFRDGPQSSPTNGEWPVLDAPLPVSDAAPTVEVAVDVASREPGQAATVTAAAADDFGVKSVTFYDGATKVATVRKPPYQAALPIAADAACPATKTLMAIAEDSAGQTEVARTTLNVTCAKPPVQPPPAAPAPQLTAGGKKIQQSGATFEVTPNAPAGVASVEFALGTRTVCALTAAPYRCRIVPTGADIGAQVLRVSVTDALGRTATVTRDVVVQRLKAKALKLAVSSKPQRGGRSRKTIKGTLVLPAGVTRAQGCSGHVTVVVRRDGVALSNTQIPLGKKCRFAKRLTIARAKGRKPVYTVKARFGGNTVLLPLSNTRRFS